MEILHGRTTEKIKIDFQQLLLHFKKFFCQIDGKNLLYELLYLGIKTMCISQYVTTKFFGQIKGKNFLS